MTFPDDVAALLARAEAALAGARFNLEGGFADIAQGRAYYAMFHAAGAALLSLDEQPKTHAGTRTRFADLFVRTGRIDRSWLSAYTDLMARRNRADYDGETASEEDVARDIATAAAFVAEIRRILGPIPPRE